MGLKSGHTTSYVIDKLDFRTILSLITHRQLRRAGENGGPVVDVDVSWVVRRCCTSMSYEMRVTMLMQLALLFIKNGCRVNLVFDGTQRHHTKHATSKRKIELLKNKVDCQVLKCQLSMMTTNQQNTVDDDVHNQQTNNFELGYFK